MQLKIGQLRKIIRENIEPEANVDDPFGEFAWPAQRKDEDLPNEPDTKIEKDVLQSLQDYLSGGEKSSDDMITTLMGGTGVLKFPYAKLIFQLMRDGKYTKVLHPPHVKMLYRGIELSVEEFQEIFGKKPSNSGTIKDFIMKPRYDHGVTSWSKSKSVAQDFAEANEIDVRVIMTASVSENGIENFLDLDVISKITEHENEEQDEVLSFGSIKCNVKYEAPEIKSKFEQELDDLLDGILPVKKADKFIAKGYIAPIMLNDRISNAAIDAYQELFKKYVNEFPCLQYFIKGNKYFFSTNIDDLVKILPTKDVHDKEYLDYYHTTLEKDITSRLTKLIN